MNNQANQILSQVFPQLEAEDIEALADVAELYTYPAGVQLCQEGAYEDTFYVVVSGSVDVTKFLTEEEDISLNQLSTGTFFGEIALVHEGPRAASVKTLVPTTLLEIKREGFRTVLEKSTPLAVRIMLQVARHLRDADHRTIAELRAKNAELAQAYARLERQERERSEFLTTVSHELRTPLTAAIGYMQFLNSGAVPPEQRSRFLLTVEHNLNTVAQLVNNILFLQELEWVKPDFPEIPLDVVIWQAVHEKAESARAGDLVIKPQVPPGLPEIRGDAVSLRRALCALLDNAIKFSPEGGEIIVRARTHSATLSIEIKDPGVGFPVNRIEDLFKPFTRIESTIDGRYLFSGVGLGLPIARHVVELHGGYITAESTKGEGSTFTIILPAVSAHAVSTGSAAPTLGLAGE